MRLTDDQLSKYHERGFLAVPDFLSSGELNAARAALTCHYPTPDEYFAAPENYAHLQASQFAGLVNFPFGAFDLNRLLVKPELIHIARQILGDDDIRLAKGELWAKFQGATNYDQGFHRDFGNHTLVVPRADHRWKELTTYIYLSDVRQGSGATGIIPRQYTDDISFGEYRLPKDHPAAGHEEFIEGPAGTLVLYSYDVFHRGVEMTIPGSSRFMILGDYARRDSPWIDRHAWPHHGLNPQMIEFMERIEPDQRNLMDFPPVGHEYWNEQTLRDIQVRYPNMNVAPYTSR